MTVNIYSAITSLKTNNQTGVTFIENSGDRFISYQALFHQSLSVLAHLNNLGVKKNQEVVIQIKDNQHFITVFWACVLGGFIPVPLTWAKSQEHRRKLFTVWPNLVYPYLILNKIQYLKYKEDFPEKIALLKHRIIFVEAIFNNSTDILRENTISVNSVEKKDVALVQFSSGSTSTPRGVVLTHENLITNLSALSARLEISSNDAMISWLPLSHDMGLILVHLHAVFSGISQYLMPAELFVRRPNLWIRKASEKRATLLYTPNFGMKHLLKHLEPDADWDLSSVRAVFDAAEPISHTLCQDFLEALSPFGLKPGSIYPAYGLAEATVGVSFPRRQDRLRVYYLDRQRLNIGDLVVFKDELDSKAACFVAVGRPLRECRVRICSAAHQVLSDGTIGHIQVKGPNVTSGYYHNPDASQRVFQDGWLDTGDLGFMHQGFLVITGRYKEVIFLNGNNYYAHDIERIIQEIPEVELGKVAAVGAFNAATQQDELIIFIQPDKDPRREPSFSNLARRAKDHIAKKADISATNVLRVDKIPKTTSGKLKRYQLRAAYENGDFHETIKEFEKKGGPPSATNDRTEKELIQFFEKMLKISPIDPTENLIAAGCDSIDLLGFIQYCHERYGIELDPELVTAYPTVDHFAGLIKASKRLRVQRCNYKVDRASRTESLFFNFVMTIKSWRQHLERFKEILRLKSVRVHDIVRRPINRINRLDEPVFAPPIRGANGDNRIGYAVSQLNQIRGQVLSEWIGHYAYWPFLDGVAWSDDIFNQIYERLSEPRPVGSAVNQIFQSELERWPQRVPGTWIAELNAGPREPIFWCAQSYRELDLLSQHLPRPIFGMRSGNHLIPYTTADLLCLARHYAMDILKIKTEGPYRLGGNCQGGGMAYLVAHQLMRMGCEIDLLILMEMNWPPPPIKKRTVLLYGEDSALNPYLYFHRPAAGFGKLYPQGFSVDLVPGTHGSFFQQPHIIHLARTIDKNIQLLETNRLPESDKGEFFPDAAYQAQITCQKSMVVRSGERFSLDIRVKNKGPVRWPGYKKSGLSLGNHWLNQNEEVVSFLDGWVPLSEDLPPGSETELTLYMIAPAKPGRHILEIDLAEQGQLWFKSKGNPTARLPVEVIPSVLKGIKDGP